MWKLMNQMTFLPPKNRLTKQASEIIIVEEVRTIINGSEEYNGKNGAVWVSNGLAQ